MIFFKNVKDYVRAGNGDPAEFAWDLEMEASWQGNWRSYWNHLDEIAARLGPKAYKFFRFGANETGLHDGFLLSLNFGDSIELYEPRYTKLRFAKGPSTAAMTILNFEKNRLHRFVFKKPRRVFVDTPSADPLFFREGKTLGQIYHYEIASISPKYLSVEWLLDSGGTILIECETLVYRSARVKASGVKKPHNTRR